MKINFLESYILTVLAKLQLILMPNCEHVHKHIMACESVHKVCINGPDLVRKLCKVKATLVSIMLLWPKAVQKCGLIVCICAFVHNVAPLRASPEMLGSPEPPPRGKKDNRRGPSKEKKAAEWDKAANPSIKKRREETLVFLPWLLLSSCGQVTD